MQIRFLLGPAGSGKTFRCLSEIRAALAAAPEGSPLVLLAPKQATFQLERQLLAGAAPPGYTRLRILSFERLAQFVFERLERPAPELLAEEGRVMVLRALLERRRGELRVFRASARLPGFARQLSQLLRELQNHHFSPARLESLAGQLGPATSLNAKLHDLALVLRAYLDWLARHQLEDADRMLDLAAEAVGGRAACEVSGVRPDESPGAERSGPEPQNPKPETRNPELKTQDSKLKISAVWLDGFAQMTPQERRLLAAVAQRAGRVTLAFCLETAPDPAPPWHSAWAPVAETFLRCRDELRALPGAELVLERLERTPARCRFENAPALQHLEAHWEKPGQFAIDNPGITSERAANAAFPVSRFLSQAAPIRLFACANPELEVELAAREIRRHVREQRARFRDVAVLLRSLEAYHDAIRRVFGRFEIPFFLDRRESVAHHPLAELTRGALRVAAHGWDHDDWFGALKTGLVHGDDDALDRLENEALARGWRGKAFWLEPIRIAGNGTLAERLERIRVKIVPPFRALSDAAAAHRQALTGAQLRAALRDLWNALEVARTLARWNEAAAKNASPDNPPAAGRRPDIHAAVWEQMIEWLRNLELAFSSEALALADWLPIIEAGLGNLSVGVIPPALDQVLVGAVDRSRNPDLQCAFVLGLNEGVFPAPPPAPALLTRADRDAIASRQAPLGSDPHQLIGLERYYGYIACTRARRSLVLTYARRDAEGRELNPSPFVGEVQRLFPALETENFSGVSDWRAAEHSSEFIVPWLRSRPLAAERALVESVPGLRAVLEQWRDAQNLTATETLAPELVERIYGTELRTSVSGLEDFASCPFKFFATRGLRAEERAEFEIDPREKGSFQHEVLKEFHLRLEHDGRRWRDLPPAEARRLVRDVGETLLPGFRDGLFLADESRRFGARMLMDGLERLVETLVAWMAQYQFDPVAVETGFGLKGCALPAWRLELDGRHALLLRGRIDRIDVCPLASTGEALGVVIDYKSSARQIDPVLLHHGLELQLLAYLGALTQFNGVVENQNLPPLVPAGAFYVSLKGGGGSAKTRDDESAERDAARRAGPQHRGRFDAGRLEKFDRRGESKGDQFRYSLNGDGKFSVRGNDAVPAAAFGELVERVEAFLRQHGRDIYAGTVKVWPYRWRQETACDLCRLRAVCRFDPWMQSFRVLRPPANKS